MITRFGIRPTPRLYVLTPMVSDPATLFEDVAEISRTVDVAALLVDGRPDIVARAGADGAHLSGPVALKAAVRKLKPNYIAGAGGLRSRHDAMVAAEAGADYVMFGEPAG